MAIKRRTWSISISLSSITLENQYQGKEKKTTRCYVCVCIYIYDMYNTDSEFSAIKFHQISRKSTNMESLPHKKRIKGLRRNERWTNHFFEGVEWRISKNVRRSIITLLLVVVLRIIRNFVSRSIVLLPQLLYRNEIPSCIHSIE